jgi:transposase
MKAYSEDLRERVMRAVEAGDAREDVAGRFEVSVPSIERWVRLKRDSGGLARRRVPGSLPTKTVGLPAALPARLAAHADATLAEHCSWWHGVSGHEVSTATMSRALARLGWTRKKRR